MTPAGRPADGPLLAATFQLRGALYSLDAAVVEEVVRQRRTTAVPHAPEHVLGVMNLRGKIVSVLDLGRKLGLSPAPPDEERLVYIVRDRSELVGLVVDRAGDVVELDAAALEPPPANVHGVESRFLQGIGRAGGRLVAVLEPAAVLGSDLERTVAGAEPLAGAGG